MSADFFRYVWQHSRREQIIVLLFVVGSLPFYWWSLDIPKRIVNEAIQGSAFADGKTTARYFDFSLSLPDFLGGYTYVISDGTLLTQLPYLYALSLTFLALTLVNGWFKYVINIRKGILGERMLRRLRFDLFARVLRFPPENVRSIKPAEISSMIKDEVEPIGGFFGEAFITPAFLGTQAITAMGFILTQNLWLGGMAFALIAVQGVVIPHLRREQIRLGRERQLESRLLAGRIGEMIEAAPALHAYGITRYSSAEIGKRLGTLFDIRMRLYRRKFAVKYLNNLLAQLTPFVFYILGGYLALKGKLDIGQLVAVIAAYRDLPGPIKELIDWDQQRADVTVKYEQVVGQFARDFLLPEEPEPAAEGTPPAPDAPITIVGLRVVNGRGVVQLERLSTVLSRPAHIAVVGPAGSGRDVLLGVLGRQISDYQGSVTIGDRELSGMSDQMASSTLVYASSDPFVMSGSIRENLCYFVRRAVPHEEADGGLDRAWRVEARLTDNPVVSPDSDWIDYAAIGVSGPEELDQAIITALRIVRGYDDIFRIGLSSRLGDDIDAQTAQRLLEVRARIPDLFRERGVIELVEPFEPDTYNTNATIGENMLFGVPVGQRFAADKLASDGFVRSIIAAEALTGPLAAIGLKMLETVADVFQGLAPDHPLRERYSFIEGGEVDELWRQIQSGRQRGDHARLPPDIRDKLIGYALMYVEPRHRLSLIDANLTARILRARTSFRQFLPASAAHEIEFYDPSRLMPAANIRDNLLFGRIRYGKAHERHRLLGVAAQVLDECGLGTFVVAKGLDEEAGPGGRLLSPQQRATIQLARAMLRHPDMLVLHGALSGFSPSEAHMILKNICEAMKNRTIIVSMSEEDEAIDADLVLSFEGSKLVSSRRREEPDPQPAAGDDTAQPAPQEVGA
ncbi:ABC transporter transmembrane domain-containing protein [Ancylobacter terrae]|uniref:ABC transporter transmembrane domain-containing protein n=1 Tax=Ancylobacter sp. sgz301288 TaxID=3342077 RepID=UPI003858C39E